MELWHKQAIVYQIYPKSFNDTNGDGIGDIRGIIEKIPYLKELGVNTVWLSPCFPSPNDDNGYDISDYRGIAPEYGTLDEFKEMLDTMHKNGIRLLLDLVVNHTSDEHEWFLESKKSKDNKYRDYYIWRDPVDGKEPNGWTSAFGGSAWQFDEATGQYYLHLYSKKQPDLNWENELVRQEIADMVNYWLDMGVDGFRCDVINSISKDFSSPYGGGNGPRLHEFLHELHLRSLGPHKALTVGETWGLTPNKVLELTGEEREELTMSFQFEHLLLGRINGDKFAPEPVDRKAFLDILAKWEVGLKDDGFPVLVMENHDQPRALSRFGDPEKYPFESATMLSMVLYGMRGVPFIFQGQELGLKNPIFNSIDEYRDIETINAYNELNEKNQFTEQELLDKMQFGSRDNSRVPICWSQEKNGGFTSGTPWIKSFCYKGCSVAEQENDEGSVLNFYRKLLKTRANEPIITEGLFELVHNEDGFSVYTMSNEDGKIFVATNFSEVEKTLPVYIPEAAKVLISNYNDVGKIFKPFQSVWYKL